MDKTQMAILQEEFLKLPSQRIEDVQLEETLFEILNYIHNENNRNVLVTHSKIEKTFSISKVTNQKRIESLIGLGLIFSRKQGKAKMLHVTEKGKKLLAQRYVV
jgi:predicted transcriptional regulator